ncbi:TetR/AcrR family transcriptional regulator [Mycobacterium vicinigordonae]|uniref:TetR/AcrR family transcriptional regulator n=2 Tax=Mycobacterium vicinigordonae TaxID=1719132 RepID=A0A7D6HYX5_9MYCO|nr:TetR/AcrR family transcriptional regulator [Mycobacterium vicinigordonae]
MFAALPPETGSGGQHPGVRSTSKGTSPQRRWAKTSATQRRILDAATDVFAEKGFTTATIADVVSASGGSIGSIYHHFGGKSELFLAIFEQLTDAVVRRIEAALREAAPRRPGRRQVFELTVQAFLHAMWENRRAAVVLASGDTPPGFELIRRNRMESACRSWMAFLQLESSPSDRLLGRLLITTVTESSMMVTECDDQSEVQPIIDAAIEWMDRLTL